MDVLPDQLWDAAKAAGWFGTAFTLFMWWLERGERRDLQKRNDDLVERLFTAASNTTAALTELKNYLLSQRGGTA